MKASARPVRTRIASRDGVGASCVALPPGPWATLIDFLSERFTRIDRREWVQRFAAGDVLDEAGQPLAVDQAYCPHTRVYYFRQVQAELPIPFEARVLYQDDHLLVADKPHFLPVVPSGRYLQETLLVRLKRQLGLDDMVPVHRIDQDTAGLVLFSVNPASRAAYVQLFRQRQVLKQYEAVTHAQPGVSLPETLVSRLAPSASFMVMQEVPGTPNAETRVELLRHGGTWAHYRLMPHTGQRHQLRVQLAGRGQAIVNDRIYPVLHPELPLGVAPDHRLPLQLLAKRLAFTDPVSGAPRVFESGQRLLHEATAGVSAGLSRPPHTAA